MVKKPNAHFYKTKRSNSLAARRRRTRVIMGVSILIIFASAIFGLSWFLNQPFIVINNLTVSGNSLVATNDIVNTVKNIIADSYLGLFAKNNILIYPEKIIRQTLVAAFPAIKEVSGNLKNWQTLQLSVRERSPFALWCQSIDSADCFYLDDDGLIFSVAPVFSNNIFLKFAGGQISASSSPIGKNFLSNDEFRQLNFFLDSLTPLGLMPISLEVGIDEYQIYLKNGGRLIIGAADDLSKVLENLKTIFHSENLKKAFARGGAIDYIDFRYGNKVFYKFKN